MNRRPCLLAFLSSFSTSAPSSLLPLSSYMYGTPANEQLPKVRRTTEKRLKTVEGWPTRFNRSRGEQDEATLKAFHEPRTPVNTFALFAIRNRKKTKTNQQLRKAKAMSSSLRADLPQEEDSGLTGLSSTTSSPNLPAVAGTGLPFASPEALLLALPTGADPAPSIM